MALTKAPKNILTVRLSSLGDVVQATGVHRALRERFPETRLTHAVLAEFAAVLEPSPYLNHLVCFDRRELRFPLTALAERLAPYGPFDWALDIQGSTASSRLTYASGATEMAGRSTLGLRRGWSHVERVDHHRHSIDELSVLFSRLNWPAKDLTPELYLATPAQASVQTWLAEKKLLPKSYLVFHPFTSVATRDWGTDKFAHLVERASAQFSLPIVITGSANERTQRKDELALLFARGAIPAVGYFTLSESLAIFAGARAVVSGDTGPMHAAAALGTPVLALIGPSWPQRSAPWGANNRVLQKEKPPTHHAFRSAESAHYMNQIHVEDVMQVLGEMLG